MDPRIEGRIAAFGRIQGHGAGHQRARQQVLGGKQRGKGERRRNLGAVDQREALLGAQFERREPGGGKAVFGRNKLTLVAHAADADQRRPQVRERRKIARGPDRTLQWDAGVDLVLDQPHQRLDHVPAHAGMAPRQTGRLEHEHEPYDGVVQERSRPRAMRQDQVPLQARELAAANPPRREFAETRVDAEDDLAARDQAVDCHVSRPPTSVIGL